ncbi:hypothetical protein [Halosegnis sp.]|uniref:hypothetical protein n=1 Tax=Halosegnis sp. TaxID=2864959 RepID=UPI0035D486FB
MPTPIVAAGLGALLAAALLKERAFSARAVAVVLAAAVAPDLDALLWLVDEGLHNAALHNIWIPGAGALALRSRRGQQWLRGRFGPDAVAIAWVAVAAYAAAVALDLFNVESAAVLWPLHDRFFAVAGGVVYSTTQGVEITLLKPTLAGGPWLPGASYGTVAGSYRVPSFFDPVAGPDGGAARRLLLVGAGWELLVVLAGGIVAGGRLVARPTLETDEVAAGAAGED